MSELQSHLGRLHGKLAEAEEALKMLANTKRELKEDLTVKVVTMMAGLINDMLLIWTGRLLGDRQTEVYGHAA